MDRNGLEVRTDKMPSEYINSDGFVTVEPNAPANPGEGNGFLQTGVAWACGLYPHVPIETMIIRSTVNKKPSLIWRSPWKHNQDDNQACDDYWGVLPMDPAWARKVLEFAELNGWDFSIWDNSGLNYSFDRHLHFPPFVRLCANRKLSLTDKFILLASGILDAIFVGHADGNMKAFCRLSLISQKMPLGAAVFEFWKYKVRKKYGTIGKCWAEYFGVEHPLSKFD